MIRTTRGILSKSGLLLTSFGIQALAFQIPGFYIFLLHILKLDADYGKLHRGPQMQDNFAMLFPYLNRFDAQAEEMDRDL